jgi:FF domain
MCGFVGCLRRLFFEELLGKAQDRAAKEEKRHKKALESFVDLLHDTRALAPETSWEEAKPLLEKEPEFKAVRVPTVPACLSFFRWLLAS